MSHIDRWAQACRSVLLAANRRSLESIVKTISGQSSLRRLYYWPSRQACLIEAVNKETLQLTLRRLPQFSASRRFGLNSFRVAPLNAGWRLTPDNVTSTEIMESLMTKTPVVVEKPFSEPEIYENLLMCDSVSEQMVALFERTKMSEGDYRLRYAYANAVQEILCDICPGSTVQLYGSSVNGLGNTHSDMDLLCTIGNTKNLSLLSRARQSHAICHILRDDLTDYKQVLSVGKFLQQVDANITSSCALHGRVPIFHFHHSLLGIYCDLSTTPSNGVDMSNTLYTLCAHFPFLQPMVFTIKHIMRSRNIISGRPQVGFTSFKILALLLHFLQQSNYIVAIDCMIGFSDNRRSFRSVADVTMQQLKSTLRQTPALEDLLVEFFDYILNLNPGNTQLSLTRGSVEERPKCDPYRDFLVCTDAFDPDNNVTRNIVKSEWTRFCNVVTFYRERLIVSRTPRNDDNAWGLLELLGTGEPRFTSFKDSSEYTPRRAVANALSGTIPPLVDIP